MVKVMPEARLTTEMVGADTREDQQETNWISIWGMDQRVWDLEMLWWLKDAVPRLKCVVPIISDHKDMVALFEGPICEVPHAATLDVNGVAVQVLLDTVIPAMVAGIVNMDHKRE